MGFIAKRLIKQDLDLVDVLVTDNLNEYFNVIDLPTTLTQGRSAFKIFGSKFLRPGVPLKMEILDASGNTVFLTPVDLVGEEVAPFLPYRFVTVEVYRPPVNVEGLCKLTILGEIDPSAVDFEIPLQFQNTYNVKFNLPLNIDLSTNVNTQPIRFYRNPTIEAEEKVRPRIVETPITTTVQVFASASAEISSTLTETTITVTPNDPETVPGIPESPSNKLAAAALLFSEDFSYKTQRDFKFPPILARRGMRNFFASPEPPAFTITVPGGGLKSSMQGATITIPQHTQTIPSYDEELDETINTEVTIEEFTTTIFKVIDEHTFVPVDIPFIPEPTSNQTLNDNVDDDDPKGTGSIAADGGEVIVPELTDVPISMSFTEYEETILSSSVHFDSFMELKVKNMRTFSGDVYRLKVHGAMKSKTNGFESLGEAIVESPELLVDKASRSGFARTGYFYTQSLVDTYWTGSSYDGNTEGQSVTLEWTGSQYIDSLRLSGSNYGVNQTIVAEQKLGTEFRVDRSVPYTLLATVSGIPTDKEQTNGSVRREGKLYFHLSGSNLNNSKKLPTNAQVGGELTDVDTGRVVVLRLDPDLPPGYQKLQTIEFTFNPRLNLDRINNTDTIFQMRADSGRWHISDLSLRPAMDSGFSPDEYDITIPIPRSTRPDKLNTFIEFFDINNNVAEEIAAKKDIEVLGSALVIDGDDNLLTGSLYMGNIAGAGIEMAGANSAYMRSVGYKGFISASEQGHGGFMLFSGSVLPDESDSYEGAGLEIHDGTTGEDESYFKFRTKPSIFDVKTKTFFLGSRSTGVGGGSSNFISGSQGNLEISSSGFVVTADGNVTASNFQFISGVVSEDVTILGTVSANEIQVPASIDGVATTQATALAFIQSTGNAKFASGSIGGFSIGTNAITATNFELNPSDKFISLGTGNTIFIADADDGIQLGHATFGSAPFSVTPAGVLKAESGTIGGFTLSSDNLTATNFTLSPSGKSISLGSGDNIFIVDGDVGMQLGDATFADAPFSVTVDGAMSASIGNIGGWTLSANDITSQGLLLNSSGRIESANYASNQFGFRIDARNNGEAEFENVRIRGTLKTTVFEKETVNAVGGQLYVANSSTITGSDFFGTYIPSASATTATMSIANVSGFTGSYGTTGAFGGEILAIKKVTSTGFSTEYVQVHSASRVDAGSDIDLRGHIYVTRAYNEGVAGDSGSLGDLASTAASYAEGQVLVSTGKIGTGFIRLNANPNDFTTPYMDIVERTGSGVYDTQLKVRLGDLSGLSRTRLQGTDPAAAGFGLYSENVFLEGGIIANTGSIAGVRMEDSQLFLGTGTHGNSNTPFYVSGKSDATSGDFSLGDKFVWDNSEENLAIVGAITITGGDAAAQIAGIGVGADASASAAQAAAATDATTKANAASSSASSFASAGKLVSAQVVVSSAGMELRAANGTVLADYGSDAVLTGGTITLRNSTNNNDKLVLSENSMVIFDNNNEVASFGANTIIEGGTITLRNTGNTDDNVVIAADSFTVNDNGNAVASFGANTILEGGSITLRSTANNDDNVVITADSFTVNDNGNAVASFGANTVIEGGSITLRSTANTDDNVVITADSFTVNDNGNAVASFGANTVIEGGTVRIQNVTNTGDALLLAQDSLKVLDNGTEVASFGGTTTIGDTGGNHVSITSTTLKLKNAGAEIISLAEGAVTVSGSLLEKTKLFGDGSDGVVALTSNTNLARDMYYKDLTVTNCFLTTKGFRIFVKDKLHLNGGTIRHNGTGGSSGGSGGGNGGAGAVVGTLQAGTAGSKGGAPGNGDNFRGGGGGGGGGSGGIVFIYARELQETGTGTIRATGGTGGQGGSSAEV